MKRFKLFLQKLTPFQLIAAYYIIAVSVSVALLSMPVAHQPGVDWGFMDGLFTAVSAVSVTGLSVVNISDTLTVPGIFILMFVLQFGGIGVMTLGTFVWLIVGKRIGLRERRLIMADQNQYALSGIVNLMKQILLLILIIEFSGGMILGTYFLKYYPTWQEAFLHGFFNSVSATTNGGFDITGASMIPYSHDYFIQFVIILLITLGAIGFPVLIEVKTFLFSKKGKYRFTLFTKLTTVTYALLVIGGTIMIALLEFQFFFLDKSWHETFFYSLFQSTATRSGGLATMDVSLFSEATLLILCALMFIGASPSSVGGGIRTTTFALNLLALYHFAKGNKTIKIFKRELHEDDVKKSLVVTLMAFVLCFTSVFILSITERFTFIEILFEVCSAFGTTGLSMGITPDLSIIGKCIIMVLMFIGRIGIVTFIYIIGSKEVKPNYHYPKERVIIG
ncbi:TrkH family potassium uptake protein [Metabacillus idriensis]|uniref:TrkH family potassium uptake protein n=1 Tax=Metabacillus idriensis TaxID=324768 RepID=UPI0008A9E855|nr:TrkH family potassium uptake protein [Metabacillus idriensis]MCM3594739.1 TrkH family potassium uptake protein [Metabacillus idriensis]OHR69260.1 Ktr system potassium uptake protein D [Bacillus sp. HMSC76G11]